MTHQLPVVGQDSGVFHPDTAAAARRIISQDAREYTAVLYFTKADGTARRMVCRYYDSPSRTADTMVVWDIEKGAYRTIRLDRVHTVKVLVSRPAPQPQPAPDREAARRRLDAMKAELHEMF